MSQPSSFTSAVTLGLKRRGCSHQCNEHCHAAWVVCGKSNDTLELKIVWTTCHSEHTYEFDCNKRLAASGLAKT